MAPDGAGPIAKKCFLIDKVRNEVKNTGDDLSHWMSNISLPNIYSTAQESVIDNYRKVLKHVQTCGLYKVEALREWSKLDIADPWIIASAMTLEANIITFETSKTPNRNQPSKNAKIPDVATVFGLSCYDLYYFMRKLNFKL